MEFPITVFIIVQMSVVLLVLIKGSKTRTDFPNCPPKRFNIGQYPMNEILLVALTDSESFTMTRALIICDFKYKDHNRMTEGRDFGVTANFHNIFQWGPVIF